MSRTGTIIRSYAVAHRTALRLSAQRVKRSSAKIKHLYETGGEAETIKHLSVFGLGPIPLLIYLGTLLSNKIATDFFQRHRDAENWTWKDSNEDVK